MLRLPHLKSVVAAFVLMASAAQIAHPQQAPGAPDNAPLLTLDDAVSLALKDNRLVKNTALEVEKFTFQVNTARSRRLPQFQFNMLGGELLHSFDFSFPAGSWGTYPGIGPLPSKEAKVHTPAVFTTYLTGSVDEPLLQQYKIGLAIRETKLGREIASEDVRAERQKIAAEVRNAYFQIVATQTAIEATRQAVATLQEAQRVTAEHEAQQTVLRGEALEVSARLAKSRYELALSESALDSQHEQLNELLGREVATPFRVETTIENEAPDLSLAAARQTAQGNRPEIRQADLKRHQAELDRRLAKAEYIPDLSLSIRYQGINNVQVLPGKVATAGFFLSWEPFDWGRRRNNVSEKTRAVEQARNGAKETTDQVAVEVGLKYRKFTNVTLLLKATRAEQQAAAEQLRITTNRYKEQAALVKDLLQAQTYSSEADAQFQQALSSYWTALAELRRAMGEE